MNYRGWEIHYAAGIWRAMRFGIGMNTNSLDGLKHMIDMKIEIGKAHKWVP